MNRLILKYSVPITIVILLVFAWVVYQRLPGGWDALMPLVVAAVIVWVVGTPVFIWLWPRVTVNGFRRAIVRRGPGGGPIPVNTLYAEPAMPSGSGASPSLLSTGTDDLLYVAGWLDLRDRPQVLHVPDMEGRYFSVQLSDPSSSADFAYVGTRATGSGAGDYVLTAPGWHGVMPAGMTGIPCPGRSVLVIGRVFVAGDDDQPAAYALAKQIVVAPLDG